MGGRAGTADAGADARERNTSGAASWGTALRRVKVSSGTSGGAVIASGPGVRAMPSRITESCPHLEGALAEHARGEDSSLLLLLQLLLRQLAFRTLPFAVGEARLRRARRRELGGQGGLVVHHLG